ncbi:MAG: cohesin domain-containing protein [Solirubrobacteraceae bacterium]
MKTRSLVASVAVVLGACAEHAEAPSTALAPEPIAALAVSGSTRQTGSIVTLTARLNGPALTRRAGAYAARVEFDPGVVAYVGEGDATSGLVAFNATTGVLKVAGASLDGYADGVLFNARFRVTRSSPTSELRLVIDDLRDMTARDRLTGQSSSRTALVRPWK